MKLILILSVLACSAVYTWSCCTPDQWEGTQSTQYGYSKGLFRKGFHREMSQISYDAKNERTAASIEFSDGHRTKKFKIITVFDKKLYFETMDLDFDGCGGGKMYFIDVEKNKCYTRSACKFRKACVPADAKGVNFFLGLSGVYKVEGFEFKKEWGHGWRKSGLLVDVTVYNIKDACIPVGEQKAGRVHGTDFMSTTGFVNITPGIKNATVFDIPAICNKAEDSSLMEEEPMREHFVFGV